MARLGALLNLRGAICKFNYRSKILLVNKKYWIYIPLQKGADLYMPNWHVKIEDTLIQFLGNGEFITFRCTYHYPVSLIIVKYKNINMVMYEIGPTIPIPYYIKELLPNEWTTQSFFKFVSNIWVLEPKIAY